MYRSEREIPEEPVGEGRTESLGGCFAPFRPLRDTVDTNTFAERHSCLPGKHPLFYIPVLSWNLDKACHQLSSLPQTIAEASGGSNENGESGIASFEVLESKLTGFWKELASSESK